MYKRGTFAVYNLSNSAVVSRIFYCQFTAKMSLDWNKCDCYMLRFLWKNLTCKCSNIVFNLEISKLQSNLVYWERKAYELRLSLLSSMSNNNNMFNSWLENDRRMRKRKAGKHKRRSLKIGSRKTMVTDPEQKKNYRPSS